MTWHADWTHRGEYMTSRHGVTTEEANSALDDPDRVTFTPDPSSISGRSIRIIGRAALSGRIVTVIVLDHDGTRHGSTAGHQTI